MGKTFSIDDNMLLTQAFALASQRAQTFESFIKSMDIPEDDALVYWRMVNKIRRFQGHNLPVPTGAGLVGDVVVDCAPTCWYATTRLLQKLLEDFQINEGLAVHYGRILYEPEGGHNELSLAAAEVAAALRADYDDIDEKQMKRICVQACEPTNGIELLASNAGQILLNIEDYRNKPLTASFLEKVYARLTRGVSIKEAPLNTEDTSGLKDLRRNALNQLCSEMWSEESENAVNDNNQNASKTHDGLKPCRQRTGHENHTLINALETLQYFKMYHLFPVGNTLFGYLMYFLILHRAGYHFSAHVPVFEVLYVKDKDALRDYCLGVRPENLAVECMGFWDWTLFFEQAVALLVDEQRWFMTKLEGMNRRRERYRAIIAEDESMNFRQKEVLLEAMLHSNAEFTYAIHEQRYDVSYPCARSDFARLLDMGLLRQYDDGVRNFFVASYDFSQRYFAYLEQRCSHAFKTYYHEDGSLREEFRNTDDVAYLYNKDVGFYEKELLDKTYVEHFVRRRTPIADQDGLRRFARENE